MGTKNINATAPPDEQSICLTCGFCCDGTLFRHAHLNPGERGSGELPEKIEERRFSENGKDYFRLPCLYFNGKCSIYDKKKAFVCGSYRCQLLKDLSEGKMTGKEAMEIIKDTREMRRIIMVEFGKLTGSGAGIHFREVLDVLGKIEKGLSDNDPARPAYDMLLARCNIFEALLIKNIRSAGEFKGLMEHKI